MASQKAKALDPGLAIIAYFLSCTAGVWICSLSKELTHVSPTAPRGFSLTWKQVADTIGSMATGPAGVFIVCNFFISLYSVISLVTTAVFLGKLNQQELARLWERLLKFVLFKVVFVGAVVSPKVPELMILLSWFGLAIYLRMFVGAAKDRLELLAASPLTAPGQQLRLLGLLLLLLADDGLGALLVCCARQQLSWAALLLLGFDALVIAVDASKALIRYGFNMLEQLAVVHPFPPPTTTSSSSSSSPRSPLACSPSHLTSLLDSWLSWEGKGTFMYHMELAADLATHLLTLCHYLHVWYLHGCSFHLIDALLLLDVRSVFVAAKQRISGYFRYKAATYNLNHAFPDAAQELLAASDQDCAICRDRLAAAKLLPCGHLFHLSCLRAWLQQSGSNNFTCPVCRKALYVSSATWMAAQQLRQSADGMGMHPQLPSHAHHHHQQDHDFAHQDQPQHHHHQQRHLGEGSQQHQQRQYEDEEVAAWRQIAAAAGLDEEEFQWQQALATAARSEEEEQQQQLLQASTGQGSVAAAAAASSRADDLAEAWVQQDAQQQWEQERVIRQPPTLLPWQGGHSPPGVRLGGLLPMEPSRGGGHRAGGSLGSNRGGDEGQGVGWWLWQVLGVAVSGVMYWSVVRAASAVAGNRGRSRSQELDAAVSRQAGRQASRLGSSGSGSSSSLAGAGGPPQGHLEGAGAQQQPQQQQRQEMYVMSEGDSDSVQDDPLDDESSDGDGAPASLRRAFWRSRGLWGNHAAQQVEQSA